MHVQFRLLRAAAALRRLKEVNEALSNARGGGVLAQALGIAEAAGVIVSLWRPKGRALVEEALLPWVGRNTDLVLRPQDPMAPWLVSPDEPPGLFIGSPAPEDLAKLLPTGRPYSVVLLGPSGSGKTTLARKVARLLRPGRPTVRVTGAAVEDPRGLGALLSVADMLDPSAIVIDDLQWERDIHGFREDQPEGLSGKLALFEQLPKHVPVIATIMVDRRGFGAQARRPTAGCFYLPGLRPGGRVDRVVPLLPLTLEQRREVLIAYGLADPSSSLVRRTSGLTGAYLAEVARRVSGGEPEAEVIQMLRSTAPVFYRGDPEGTFEQATDRVFRQIGRRLGAIENKVNGTNIPPNPLMGP